MSLVSLENKTNTWKVKGHVCLYYSPVTRAAVVFLRPCLYGEKFTWGPGAPSPHLPPRANFTARLQGKKREPGCDKLPFSTD